MLRLARALPVSGLALATLVACSEQRTAPLAIDPSFSLETVGTCTFDVSGSTWTLTEPCTTTETIFVPDGFTLDGNGHTVTVPAGSGFTGAVVQNAGATAHVKNLKIYAADVGGSCQSGDDRLRGIYFLGAAGSIKHNTILAMHRGADLFACPEGVGIWVDNKHPKPTHISVEQNRAFDYQIRGVIINGNTNFAFRENRVGAAASGVEAVNGAHSVQFGWGARGTAIANHITGNDYDGSLSYYFPIPFASAVLLVEAGDTRLRLNRIDGEWTDVGIYWVDYPAEWCPDCDLQETMSATDNSIARTTPGSDLQDPYGAGVYLWSFFREITLKHKVVANDFSGWQQRIDSFPGATDVLAPVNFPRIDVGSTFLR